jgi:hypothetical protein
MWILRGSLLSGFSLWPVGVLIARLAGRLGAPKSWIYTVTGGEPQTGGWPVPLVDRLMQIL